jgi:hypothetical protein
MTKEIKHLIEKAKSFTMSDADKEAQRQSFAYGNAHIENDRVTREIVAAAAARIRPEK